MTQPDSCPHCSVSLVGSPIPEHRRELYGGATHGRREIGVEDPEIYDGVLYYQCPDCGGRWHRWPEKSYLRARAEAYVAEARKP